VAVVAIESCTKGGVEGEGIMMSNPSSSWIDDCELECVMGPSDVVDEYMSSPSSEEVTHDTMSSYIS
jgi:hypothetical protein